MQLAAAAFAACATASAVTYDTTGNALPVETSGSYVIPGSAFKAWKTTDGTMSVVGNQVTVTTNAVAWMESGAYYAVTVPTGHGVKISGGTVTSSLPGGKDYYGDVYLFGMTGDPSAAIAGRAVGPNTTPGAASYLTSEIYKYGGNGVAAYRGASDSWGSSPRDATSVAVGEGFHYFESVGDAENPFDAVMNYGANAQNLENYVDGVSVLGGEYANWTYNTSSRLLPLNIPQPNGTDLTSGTIAYNGVGLGRALQDQEGLFSAMAGINAQGYLMNTTGQDMTVFFGFKFGSADALGGNVVFDNVTLTFIPEPASLGLLALGAMAFLGRRRK